MSLKLYNTLTRKKETFKSIKPGFVGMYCCGPTVYNYAHIGNLRTYIFEDILKRVLIYNGFKVKHVMNITDVGHLTSDADVGEDKIELRARREKKTAWEIAKFYTRKFFEDIERLNIIKPDITPKATEHIKDMISLIKILEKKGYTYIIENDGVYFDTSKFKDYGKLARLKIEGLKAGARVGFVKGKRNKTDFALWKFSPKGVKRQMEWESPWGIGFPGWHIECSAMAMKYLGEHFDIHCGGVDHIPIHHTNEIAQSEAATGKKWVNYWLHGEFLILEKGKMAKSTGMFITLQKLIDDGFDPLDYRYFCLNAHYRTQLRFSYKALEDAKRGFEHLKNKIIEVLSIKNKGKKSTIAYEKRFMEAINDDLNMPKALAIVWDMLKDNEVRNDLKYKAILKFDRVLGLKLDKIKIEIPKKIKELLEKREEARKKKDFELADKIREEIKKEGYVIEDTKEGPILKKAI